MAASPRRGTETSETRAQLLDVTERIMIEDGYAAVSSRRVAKGAGVTPALVHYYFGTLDELFLAIMHRRAEQQLTWQDEMLRSSAQPFTDLWRSVQHPARTGLVLEFMALANHRKSIASEIAEYGDRFREGQRAALVDRLRAAGHTDREPDALAIVTLVNAVATTLVLERSVGMANGQAEAVAMVERELGQLDSLFTDA